MRRLMIPSLAVCLAIGLVQRAPAADEPKDIIAKAIKAYGGEEKLSKLRAGKSKAKGKLELFGGISFTSESSAQLPDKFKEVASLEIMGKQVTITTVYNGKEAWVSAMGQTQTLEGKALDQMKENAHAGRVGQLVTLKEKEFTLAPLGEIKVSGKIAVGVKVSCKGHGDISLFFDKTTGLVAKTERRAVDAQSGQEYLEERFDSDYKLVNGLQTPHKIVVHRDGKKFMEAEISEVKIVEKLDDSEFAKP